MRTMRYFACGLSNAGVIPLGRTGEHHATTLVFDATDWGWTDGAALALLVRSPGGAVYPAQVEARGGVLTWQVTGSETAIAGKGEIELMMTGPDGAVIKSARCETRVEAALSQTADSPPEGAPEWVAELIDALPQVVAIPETIGEAQDATRQAQDAAQAIENLSVSAHEASEPTAQIEKTESGYRMEFGLPRGGQGPMGPAGSVTSVTANGTRYAPDESGNVDMGEIGGGGIRTASVSIPVSSFLGEGPYTATLPLAGVTERTWIDLRFDAACAPCQTAAIEWETSAGQISLTTASLPTGALTGTMTMMEVAT